MFRQQEDITQLIHSIQGSTHAEFLDATTIKSKEIYFRNHRTNGQKNLRCFPTCGETHSIFGFCGRPLKVKLCFPSSVVIKDLLVIGCFRQVPESGEDIDVSEDGTIGDRLFIPVSGIAECILEPYLRTRQSPTNQYFTARQISLSRFGGDTPSDGFWEVLFEFAVEYGSWHYGWKGGRFKQASRHEFSVSVLTKQFQRNDNFLGQPADHLALLGVFGSPPFQVNSLRRKDMAVNNSADNSNRISTSPVTATLTTKATRQPISKNSSDNSISSPTPPSNLLSSPSVSYSSIRPTSANIPKNNQNIILPNTSNQDIDCGPGFGLNYNPEVLKTFKLFRQSPENENKEICAQDFGPFTDEEFERQMLELQTSFLNQTVSLADYQDVTLVYNKPSVLKNNSYIVSSTPIASSPTLPPSSFRTTYTEILTNVAITTSYSNDRKRQQSQEDISDSASIGSYYDDNDKDCHCECAGR